MGSLRSKPPGRAAGAAAFLSRKRGFSRFLEPNCESVNEITRVLSADVVQTAAAPFHREALLPQRNGVCSMWTGEEEEEEGGGSTQRRRRSRKVQLSPPGASLEARICLLHGI